MQTKVATYPLNIAQKGIYYEWQKDKEITRYNNPLLYRFPGNTDTDRLRGALIKVVEAHPFVKLRLRIGASGSGEMEQYFVKEDPVFIPVFDVAEEELKVRLKGLVRPFDLLSGEPLYRMAVYRTPEQVYLWLDVHHIIYDGTSLTIFNRDLVEAWNGNDLSEEKFNCGDFAVAEKDQIGSGAYDQMGSGAYDQMGNDAYGHIESAAYEKDKDYFAGLLGGVTPALLPVVRHREEVRGMMEMVSEEIEYRSVMEYCKRLGISPNSLFAGALAICLNRYMRESRICFVTAHHGRKDERTHNSIGMFVKTMPVVAEVLPEQKMGDFLKGIGAGMLELWEHQTLSFCRYGDPVRHHDRCEL